MKNKKLGLIITGAISNFKDDNNNILGNSNENIIKIVNNFSYLFEEIILVTWKTEKKKISPDILLNKNIKLLYLDDPGQMKLYSDNDNDNSYRQFYSSFKAIQAFSSKIIHVVKTRNDYFIDLKKTIDFYFQEHSRKQSLNNGIYNGIICSNKFILTNPYWICDFFYIAEKIILTDYFYSQIKYGRERFIQEKVSAPESDSVLKFLYYYRKKIKIFKDNEYYPNLPKKLINKNQVYFSKEFNLWQFAIINFFSVLPEDIKKTSSWKGQKYFEYEFRIDKNKKENYDYQDFIKCENNYLKLLKKTLEHQNRIIILQTNFNLINLNYIKRKCENFIKGKFDVKFLWILIKISVTFRKLLFLIFNKNNS